MSNAASATDTKQGNAPTGDTKESRQGFSAADVLGPLRANPLVPLLIAGAAVLAIVVALLMWAQSPDYRVLYSNLSEADGGRIITELDKRSVPYRFSEGGQALLVPGEQVHLLRLQLAEAGLPQGGNVGFELMDNQAFGISQFAEQLNYQRGLEGELSRSIESLGPVSRARIHLALAKPSVFVRDREPAKASVVVTLQSGRVLGDGQVNAIVHMVSSSVPELAAEDVTVVDQNGRLLSLPTGAGGRDLDGTQLEYIENVERSYRQRIENILSPILGTQNVHAQVAAQIDFSRREETSERYAPNQTPDSAAVRSAQTSASYTGGDELARGIPGALTNTPPGAAASPIELPAAEDNGAENLQANADAPPSSLRQDNVINYEVDRNVEHIQHRTGRVQRLTVAVVVNYRDGLNEEGETIREPLSDVELAQIDRLVRQAMGFTAARGDEIEVVNSPFTQSADEQTERDWWQSPEVHSLALTMGRYLLVALAALMLYLLILRPLIKRHTQTALPAPAPLSTTFRATVGEDDQEQSESNGLEDDTYEEPTRKRRSKGYEQSLKDLREIAQEDPRLVAMIVRSWVNKND
ncbi:flagellar basal-body MS-ring/collar protein FliF [Litchfieldella xinjiangensis]|uniref:flagellar basal-body MS-ring/collar protein FliF n=1 Tax=Litchfieldella xinjiangensis TaxID=1166948 RepID=UPI0005BA3932|nr:flagellar basal-body MS-ring/collar protein FliF [Halomonas xinjiangensis]